MERNEERAKVKDWSRTLLLDRVTNANWVPGFLGSCVPGETSDAGVMLCEDRVWRNYLYLSMPFGLQSGV